ncbi:hypothetical protein GCM10027421_33550 [Microbacterium shaanxiense]
MSGIEDQGLRPEKVEPAPVDDSEDRAPSAEGEWRSVDPDDEAGSRGGTHPDPSRAGHTSQAEGEDPASPDGHPDPERLGHPSQAEGEDREDGGA